MEIDRNTEITHDVTFYAHWNRLVEEGEEEHHEDPGIVNPSERYVIRYDGNGSTGGTTPDSEHAMD